MDDSSPWLLLLRIAAGAAIIVLIFRVLFSRHADFVIHIRRGQVQCQGKMPLAMQQRLTHFLLEDLAIKDSVRILGAQRGNRLQVWFRGRISPGEQQRIRNFLTIGP
jgi:hypothetical protein